MSSDDALGLAGLLDDGVQLVVAELLVDRIVNLAHDTAEAHTLISRAPRQLEPDGSQALGHAVALPQHSDTVREITNPAHGVHVQIGMTTGRAEHRSGPEHVGALRWCPATARLTQTPSPPTSRTLVKPARRATAASLATRMAVKAGALVASSARSGVKRPMKCAWQSERPGSTAGTR